VRFLAAGWSVVLTIVTEPALKYRLDAEMEPLAPRGDRSRD
jgi:hypothetical protein